MAQFQGKTVLGIALIVALISGGATASVMRLTSSGKEAKPAGGVTPISAVANASATYVNKQISVKGYIYQSSPGQYLVVNSKTPPGNALPLDLSKINLDMSKFTQTSTKLPAGEKPISRGMFTVSGKLVERSNQSSILVVSSIR